MDDWGNYDGGAMYSAPTAILMALLHLIEGADAIAGGDIPWLTP